MSPNPYTPQLNPAAHAYLCVALWLALFFKFARPFSLRNLDVLLIQLPVFGLLALPHYPAVGYGLLLAACTWYVVRSLFDPALQRRPALGANATPGALTFLATLSVLTTFLQLDAPRVQQAPLPAAVEDRRPLPTVDGPVTLPVTQLTEIARRRPANLWLTRLILTLLHVLIALALAHVGVRWFADRTIAAAMAAAYLLSPYPLWAGIDFHQILPAVLLVWAIALFDHPLIASALLALTAVLCDGFVWLLPIWGPVLARYDSRQFWSGLVAGAVLGLLVAWLAHATPAVHPERLWIVYLGRFELSAQHGLWGMLPEAFRLPAVAGFLCVFVLLLAWPLHKNLADLVAASAALLTAAQWWYPLRGGTYTTWFMPLLILLAFRPTVVRVKR